MRSLAEASAAMESEFRAKQAQSMENMRQMMELISREKSAVVHRFEFRFIQKWQIGLQKFTSKASAITDYPTSEFRLARLEA